MQKVKTSQQAGKQIEELKLKINKLKTDPKLLNQVVNKVKDLLVQHHLGIVVSMYHNESLYILLENLLNLFQNQKSNQVKQIIQMVYEFGNQCIFNFDSQYKKLFKSFNIRYTDIKKANSFLGKNIYQQYVQYKDLIKYFMEIKHVKKIEIYEQGIRLNEYVNQQLNKNIKIYEIYTQVIITWLRIQVTRLRTHIFKQKGYSSVGLCCTLHFQESQEQFSIDFPNHFCVNINHNQVKLFEEIRKQKENKFVVGQAQTIKKTLVYFLNNEGGHLFLGIKEMKNRNGTAVGIQISNQERINYLKAIQKQIITKIFPTDNQNQEETQAEEDKRLQAFIIQKSLLFNQEIKNGQYCHSLCESIDIQFLPLYNPRNLLFSKSKNGNMLFVIRMRVKVGNPAEVYHFLNPKDIPQAYIEQNKFLTMIQYYDLVYSKLKNEANGKAVPKQPKTHPLCRYSLKYEKKEQQKKVDSGSQQESQSQRR